MQVGKMWSGSWPHWGGGTFITPWCVVKRGNGAGFPLWYVTTLPGALPEILTGLRIGLGVGWSTLVAAELIAATRGLGFMVQ